MSEEQLQELRTEYDMNELRREVHYLRKDLEASCARLNQLEKVHNRLALFCGMVSEITTIDPDN